MRIGMFLLLLLVLLVLLLFLLVLLLLLGLTVAWSYGWKGPSPRRPWSYGCLLDVCEGAMLKFVEGAMLMFLPMRKYG